MSSVGFYAHGRAVDLRGSERAYGRHLITAPSIALIQDLATSLSSPIRAAVRDRILEPSDWLDEQWSAMEDDAGKTSSFVRTLHTWLAAGEAAILVGGDRMDFIDLALNSAIAAGSPAMRLLAYLCGTCESHGYFEPPHDDLVRAIRTGMDSGVLRADMGWSSVATLAASTKAVIVMDYSVSDSWTGRGLAALRDAWWPRDFGPSLYGDEPEVFTHGHSVFDLIAECQAAV